jgi:hypothetical protein
MERSGDYTAAAKNNRIYSKKPSRWLPLLVFKIIVL